MWISATCSVSVRGICRLPDRHGGTAGRGVAKPGAKAGWSAVQSVRPAPKAATCIIGGELVCRVVLASRIVQPLTCVPCSHARQVFLASASLSTSLALSRPDAPLSDPHTLATAHTRLLGRRARRPRASRARRLAGRRRDRACRVGVGTPARALDGIRQCRAWPPALLRYAEQLERASFSSRRDVRLSARRHVSSSSASLSAPSTSLIDTALLEPLDTSSVASLSLKSSRSPALSRISSRAPRSALPRALDALAATPHLSHARRQRRRPHVRRRRHWCLARRSHSARRTKRRGARGREGRARCDAESSDGTRGGDWMARGRHGDEGTESR